MNNSIKEKFLELVNEAKNLDRDFLIERWERRVQIILDEVFDTEIEEKFLEIGNDRNSFDRVTEEMGYLESLIISSDVNFLGSVPKEDDLLILLEQFKLDLTAFATDGSMKSADYTRMRKIVLNHPELNNLAPHFLKVCRDSSDFWGFIKQKFSRYQERRDYLAQEINPLLDSLDSGIQPLVWNFEEKDLIGEGGFGQVYRYQHKLLKMDFAFKLFAPAFSQGGEGHLERFFKEARILFQLDHPNIIRVHDVGMLGKRPYIRMEYFPGRNLNQVLKEFGCLSPEKALILIKEISRAIEKPSNSPQSKNFQPKNRNPHVQGNFSLLLFDTILQKVWGE